MNPLGRHLASIGERFALEAMLPAKGDSPANEPRFFEQVYFATTSADGDGPDYIRFGSKLSRTCRFGRLLKDFLWVLLCHFWDCLDTFEEYKLALAMAKIEARRAERDRLKLAVLETIIARLTAIVAAAEDRFRRIDFALALPRVLAAGGQTSAFAPLA